MMRKMLAACAALAMVANMGPAIAARPPAAAAETRDGGHDFDFLIGRWKVHLRRLPDRLVGSNKWVEYDGFSEHRKLLDTNANFEEFDVTGPAGRIKAQTLRLYNPKSRQWSIYGLDLDAGQLPLPATIGEFTGKRGEFYDHEPWKGRMIWVRFVWLDLSPKEARMEQSFSDDGGKTWEVNWICEMTR